MKPNTNGTHEPAPDTSRPTATYTPTGPRSHTLSIAIPASLIHNSKRKLELRTNLAGSIARALAVFCVDEVVIFDDGDSFSNSELLSTTAAGSTKLTAFTNPGHFLAYMLSYLETPPFTRRRLFPMHENLEKAGTLPSLDIPSHLRADEWCEYREGITTRSSPQGTNVDCGLASERLIKDVQLPPDMRITLRLRSHEDRLAEAVNPTAPREETGYYWGYTVRQAGSLSAVFTECAFDGGYDLSLGTSERGENAIQAIDGILGNEQRMKWQHLIVVFGGVKGLEDAAKNDKELVRTGIGKGNVSELFDYWVNLLPGQGSRTVRTEEAVWMGLMATRRLIDQRQGL